MLKHGYAIILIVALVAASCSSSDSPAPSLEDELTSDIEMVIETVLTFSMDRQEQIERADVQNPDLTLGGFLSATEEAMAIVDFAIVDREVDRLTTVIQRAQDGGLETVNGASLDDLEMYAASLRDWSIAEEPQGKPLYDCLVAVNAGLDLGTPMSVVMQNQDAVDCIIVSLDMLQESLDAQAERNRYLLRINRDWEG